MSEIKVNKISPRSGTPVTLGDSGDTFTIPSGATINNQGTATNFGATGSASWTTTVKTGDFTAVAGEGYFVDTSSGEVDVALPAGSAGAVVAVADYAKNFDTSNCILVPNGSDKISGDTNNAVLSTEGLAVTLIFIDSTKGWIITDDGLQSSADTNPFIEATGGSISCSGNCRIHTFTGPGTFVVSALATTPANNQVSYMVVAGGASGGSAHGGGGGAGGFREDKSPTTPYTSSPLEGAGAITVTATSFPIVVGAGGAALPCSSGRGNSGSVSTFSTITSAGGGGGGGESAPGNMSGGNGGSGGGSGAGQNPGNGNTPPTTPAQGTNGGNCAHSPPNYGSGGGGGATVVGTNGTTTQGGSGGAGATTEINGSSTVFAGGGGGSTYGGSNPGGAGGAGGGGNGTNSNGPVGTAGTANTGGGGGGGERYPPNNSGLAGGSGIVIIRYKKA